jgi:hypothetical protein
LVTQDPVLHFQRFLIEPPQEPQETTRQPVQGRDEHEAAMVQTGRSRGESGCGTLQGPGRGGLVMFSSSAGTHTAGTAPMFEVKSSAGAGPGRRCFGSRRHFLPHLGHVQVVRSSGWSPPWVDGTYARPSRISSPERSP